MGSMSAAPIVFDRRAVRLHRDRAAATLGTVAPLLDDFAARLIDRLDDVRRPFARALDIGGRGAVAPLLRARGIHVVGTDLSPAMAARHGPGAVAADEEWLPFAPASFDLVVASLSLHWVNDLPGALLQIRRAMVPDGLFLASLPALGTLAELRAALTAAELAVAGGAAPRVSPFPELRDLAGLLGRAGFSLPVSDVEDVVLAYRDPLALLRELRAAGEANAIALRSRAAPPPALFAHALASMAQTPRDASDGAGQGVRVTLRLATMTGWASPNTSASRPP